jgi:uncharacterized membrane protein
VSLVLAQLGLGRFRPECPVVGAKLPAGAPIATASQFRFLAFALATAASVRTLALVEVLFAQAISRFVFKQPVSAREGFGIVMIVIGVMLLVWSY